MSKVIDGLSVWLVTRYDDIRKALSDARLSNDPAIADAATRAVPWVGAAASGGVSRHMLRLDPPDHTRLRRLVAKAFTPRRLEALRPRIQQIRRAPSRQARGRLVKNQLPEVVANCGLNGLLVLGKAQIEEQLFKLCEVGDVVKVPLEDRHQPRSFRFRQGQASVA